MLTLATPILASVSKMTSSVVKMLTRVSLPPQLLPSAVLAEEVDEGSVDIAGLDTPVIKLDHLTQYHQVRSLVSLLCLSFLVSLVSLFAAGLTHTALVNFFVKLCAWLALLLCIRLRVLEVRNLVFVLLLVAIAAFATQTRQIHLDPNALPPFIRQLFQFSFVPLLAAFMIRGGHGASLVVGLALLLYVGNYYNSVGRQFRVPEEGDHSLFMGGLVAQLYPVCIFRLYQGEVRMFQVLLSKFLANSEARSKEKTIFISRMSHELRTPLHGLLSTVKLLGHTPLSQEQSLLISTVETCGDIVLEVLRKVLDIVKIESGGFGQRLTDFSLFDLVREATESMVSLAEGKAIELFVWFEPHPQGYDVRGDQTHLKEILLNLLDNAFKFTKAGSITIRVQRQNASWGTQGSYLFEIEDTGVGISPEDASLIFAPFKQLHGQENHKGEGSGLGLSLVKKLTEFLGGGIGVKSSPGGGSTFWFRLPLEALPEGTFRPALFSLPWADPAALSDLARQLGRGAGTLAGMAPGTLRVGTNATGRAYELLSLYLAQWEATLVSVDSEDLLSRFVAEQGGRGCFIVDDDPALARKLVGAKGKSHRVVLFSSLSKLSGSLQAFGSEAKARVAPKTPGPTSAGAVATKPLEPLKVCEALLFLVGGDDRLIRTRREEVPSSGEARRTSQHLAVPRAAALEEGEIDVLVVEDDSVTQMVMRKLLEKGNIRYFITPSGEAGLEAWKACKAPIPLIFMDVEVEGALDGLQVTAMIRDLERGRERPGESSYIVVMTGRALVSDQEEALSCGCDEFLSKPVKIDKLREITRARAQRRAEGC